MKRGLRGQGGYMLVCEVIYGCERGAQLSAFLESAMGQPCPCKAGQPCPLLPRQGGPVALELVAAPVA